MRRTADEVTAEHAAHAGSGPHDGPRCDCRHDGTHWQRMCAAAQADADAMHTAAMIEYRNTHKVSPWD